MIEAHAPGRVNLIGDHTDHTGGLVMPMAINLGTTVLASRVGSLVELRSDHEAMPAIVPLDVADPAGVAPDWARYVAGVVAELRPSVGLEGEVLTTLPVGAGLSSSAALLVSVALALGAEQDHWELARLCQRAEQRAVGVPCGIMDPLVSLAGRAGHALLIDTGAGEIEYVPLPAGAEFVVLHSGSPRELAGSPYAERRARCEAADAAVGPLRELDPAELAVRLARRPLPPDVEAAGRHVVGENARVRRFASALRSGDLAAAGRAMVESHASLRDDLEVSTDALDALVERLLARPGVHGARLTGAGFGGCVVALCEPGVLDEGWALQAADGAWCRELTPR